MKPLFFLASGLFFAISNYAECSKNLIPPALLEIIATTTIEDHWSSIEQILDELEVEYKHYQEKRRLKKLNKKESLDSDIITYQLKQCKKFQEALLKKITRLNNGVSQPPIKAVFSKILKAQRKDLFLNYSPERLSTNDKAWQEILAILEDDQNEQVHVQNFLIDFVIQMVIMSGENYAKLLFSQEDQAKQQALSDQIKAAQRAYNDQKTAITNNTKDLIGQLSTSFKQQLAVIQNDQGLLQTQYASQMEYINRFVNLSKPSYMTLALPIWQDLVFAASPMLAPSNGYTWYNYYQTDDWQYDTLLKGFVQRGPTGSQSGYIQKTLPKAWASATKAVDSAQGATNYIFTEYYTSESAYQISCEISLINCAYPFCAGLMFNVARFLPGTIDRPNTYRFAGLYGVKDSNNKPTVALYAGQTSMDMTAPTPNPITPIDALINGTLTPLYTLTSKEVAALGADPQTYVVTITNQENAPMLSLSKGMGKDQQQLFSGPLDVGSDTQFNQLVFWYHGIGFMAPGCQALFRLTQPTALTYTTKQIDAFKKKITSLKKELAKS